MTEHDTRPVGHWRGRVRDVAADLFDLAYPALSVAIAVLTWPALIAERHGRDSILIELNPEYARMARDRIKNEAPLLADVA